MRSALALLLVLVTLGPAGAAGQAPSAALTLPLTQEAGLLFLEVELRDEAPLLALLDTGASASAIDPRRSRELAVTEVGEVVGTTGALQVEMVVVEGLRLGSLELPALRATRRELGGLLAPAGRRVDLILGSDALAGLVVTIDFERASLELARESVPDPEQASVPMLLDNGIPTLAASLGGLDTSLRIDTGASLFESADVYVNIPTKLWQALRARHPDLLPSSALQGTGADGKAVDLPVAALAGARIGPLALERVFVIVQPELGYFADPQAKGFVGNNFLKRLGRVTLDYPAGRLLAGP